MRILDILKLPIAKELEGHLDSPETALIHRNIIQSKPFLKRLYLDMYHDINVRIPLSMGPQCIIELGSGAGFIKEVIPQAITSDVFSATWIDKVFTAERMPFADGSVDAFVMLNVFHHLPDVQATLQEMSRSLKKNGKIIMIEPANTPWQRFITRKFHHEPFDPEAGWELKGTGRLSAGNVALPWIVFTRDRARFHKEFPSLEITAITRHTPFRYILTGGLTYRAFLPDATYPLICHLEKILTPLMPLIASFQTIEITKR